MPTFNPFVRFWSKTRVDGHCLIWTGSTSRGYGKFKESGKLHRAHKWIYEKTLGKLTPGKILMHSCDNEACVALQHLSPGDQSLNLLDASAKGRLETR